MLDPVVIVGEGAAGVVRRIDVDAADLAGELGIEREQGGRVVAADQAVVVQLAVDLGAAGAVRSREIFDQGPRVHDETLGQRG